MHLQQVFIPSPVTYALFHKLCAAWQKATRKATSDMLDNIEGGIVDLKRRVATLETRAPRQ